ncbi:hypothetical protein VTJ49DRAFT_3928 [Mycothermus thermophilus]|uniref:Uncharacterized protein n=1 Tax=Humicola insolens TaxID=85995 RepID=A0ABR3V6L2_HUMIN
MDRYSVLQRPPHFDEDGGSSSNNASNNWPGASEDRGPRGGLRDILNPVSVSSTTPATAPPPPRPQPPPFSLRSPTQPPDYRHHQTAPASRSILNSPSPYASPAVSLPPHLQAPPSLASATPTAATTQQHQQPPQSPLHAPPVYFPAESRDHKVIREKSVSLSGFYDPTTDSSSRDNTRRGSDTGSAWRTDAQTSPPKPQVSNANLVISLFLV